MCVDEEQRIKDINNSERDLAKGKEFWSEELEDDMDTRAFLEEANESFQSEAERYRLERDKLIAVFEEAYRLKEQDLTAHWRGLVEKFCKDKKR